MQTVFIVTQGCYSDYHIERIFTNKKAAKKYVEYLKSYEDDYFIESIDIKEYELNDDYDKDKLSDRGYLVRLWKRGEEFRENVSVDYDAEVVQKRIGWKAFGDRGVQIMCLKPRKDETKGEFEARARKIIIDEWYIWKQKKQEGLTMINSKQGG